jgi:hypothetical protein
MLFLFLPVVEVAFNLILGEETADWTALHFCISLYQLFNELLPYIFDGWHIDRLDVLPLSNPFFSQALTVVL